MYSLDALGLKQKWLFSILENSLNWRNFTEVSVSTQLSGITLKTILVESFRANLRKFNVLQIVSQKVPHLNYILVTNFDFFVRILRDSHTFSYFRESFRGHFSIFFGPSIVAYLFTVHYYKRV